MSDKYMVGAAAIEKLGASKKANELEYIINDESTDEAIIHEGNRTYYNANGHPFYKAVWEQQKGKVAELASPQSLIEIAAFHYGQACENSNQLLANNHWFDIKFLSRRYHLFSLKIANLFISDKYLTEINGMLKEIKKQLGCTCGEFPHTIGEIFEHGYQVFETPDKFNEWLTSSIKALGGKTPLSYISTEEGAEKVAKILNRLERGVYS